MIAAVILAAGASSRMGAAGPKALARDREGRTFLGRVNDRARSGGASLVVVVIGPPHGEAIARALPEGVLLAENPHPERGMLSSVQAGIAALPSSISAALVWPVDIPKVRVETVRAILAAPPDKMVVPCAKEGERLRGGHPIRIPRARFSELLALAPEGGLRALLAAHPDDVERLPIGDPGILVDVDTPEALARFLRVSLKCAPTRRARSRSARRDRARSAR